jgi:hypothetical protein
MLSSKLPVETARLAAFFVGDAFHRNVSIKVDGAGGWRA